MPSARHEALVDLFRERPTLAWDLLAAVDPSWPPPRGPVERVEASFSTLQLPTLSADLVLDDGQSALIILEVQLRPDPDKGWVWPLYLASLAHQRRRPVVLVVLALHPRRLGGSVDLGPCLRCEPVVVGVEQIPAALDGETARANPELAVLSAVAHAHAPGAVERAVAAVEAAATLDDLAARVYVDLVVAALPEASRRQLEALMLSRYEFQSDFARRFFSAGRQEGLQEGLQVGQREVVGRLLRRRFGPAASALISRLETLDGGALAHLADALMDGADLASLEAGLANLRLS